jgi:putative transposase
MEAVEVLTPEVGTKPACAAVGLSRASVYRLRARRKRPQAAPPKRPSPPRALKAEEQQQVLGVLHSEKFMDKAPQEVYAALLDEGQYVCSIRTMYRLLEANQEVKERRNQLRHPAYQKPELLATAPNRWRAGTSPSCYFYLYVILDVFRRYAAGSMASAAPKRPAR